MVKESSAGEDVARLAGGLVKLEKLYVISYNCLNSFFAESLSINGKSG